MIDTPTPARPALYAMAEEIERLCEAATPGDLATAEGGARDQEDVECPACGGEGSISATDYCNFDGAATGVQFFGIGKEFGAHEALWRFFMANRKDICAALRSVADMRGAIEKAEQRLSRRFVQNTRDGVFCELCAEYDRHSDDCPMSALARSAP